MNRVQFFSNLFSHTAFVGIVACTYLFMTLFAACSQSTSDSRFIFIDYQLSTNRSLEIESKIIRLLFVSLDILEFGGRILDVHYLHIPPSISHSAIELRTLKLDLVSKC